MTQTDSSLTRMATTAMRHQEEELAAHALDPVRGLLWEQGTGKTFAALASACAMHRSNLVDGLLVIAPNGVHSNWALDEIPMHVPADVRARVLRYETTKAGTRRQEEAARALLEHQVGLSILAMSYNAFMTKAGRKLAEAFLARKRTLMVLDESQRIKNPSAQRSRAIARVGRRAVARRILSGTPITKTPFDIYTQIKFLDWDFWSGQGFESFSAFKTYFGIWETFKLRDEHGKVRQEFQKPVAFRNLEQLKEMVHSVSSRVLKEEALDLPPKVYRKRYFDLSPTQSRFYETLRKQMVAYLDSGERVSTPLAMTMLLRLQQVTCGYVPTDETGELVDLEPGRTPRLTSLLELAEDMGDEQAIIFSRFRPDVGHIIAALGPDRCVRYDGAVGPEDRILNRRKFQAGDAQYFVGTTATASVGLTLHAACHVAYYSNSFNLEDRLQSEDRIHRHGQARTCTYDDIVAEGTVDIKLVRHLRAGRAVAAEVTGDTLREWI